VNVLILFSCKVNGNSARLCYNKSMNKRRISQTNPYLKDRHKRRAALIASVCSSSAIEGITTASAVIDELLLKKEATPHRLSVTARPQS
jgi:hypothetical protein